MKVMSYKDRVEGIRTPSVMVQAPDGLQSQAAAVRANQTPDQLLSLQADMAKAALEPAKSELNIRKAGAAGAAAVNDMAVETKFRMAGAVAEQARNTQAVLRAAEDWFMKKQEELDAAAVKVEIPNEGYLLWDKPLSEQSDLVKAALKEAILPKKNIYTETGLMKEGGSLQSKGYEFYSELSIKLGGDKAASDWLREHGLAGIKYLDGDSRAKGEGSYNYVVFDDSQVNIEQTYYQDNKLHKGLVESKPWPKDFPKVMINTTLASIKSKYKELHAKAKAGDNDAAVELVRNVIKPGKIKELVKQHPNAIVVPVQAEEKSGRNRIPVKYAKAIANAGDLELADNIVQTVRAFHTGADAFSRLTRRPVFDGEVKAGREYIIVDDHITMGGTLNELRKYIESKGGKVVAVTTLTASQGATTMALTNETKMKLKERFGDDIDRQLEEAEISKGVDELTEAEGRYLLKLLPDTFRDRIATARSERIIASWRSERIQGSLSVDDQNTNETDAGSKSSSRRLPSLSQENRGSITFSSAPGQPARITLGRDADRSTFVHELAHFYLAQLRTLQAGPTAMNGPNWTGPKARWNQDLQVISDWWNRDAENICGWIGKEDYTAEIKQQATAEAYRKWLNAGMETQSELGQAFDRAGHEYFARGFEAYLREGVAPAKQLTGLFRRFKAWLCAVYKNLTELDVELSDDIRQVFDRMVATDDAIEQLRAEHEIDRLLEKRDEYASAPEMSEEEALNRLPFDDDPYEAAKEYMLGKSLEELSPERKAEMAARAEEVRPDVMNQIMAEKSWQVLSTLTQNPDMRLSEQEIIDRFGESALDQLPADVTSQEGMSLDDAARNFEYDSPGELLGALAGKDSVKAETDRRVRAVVEAELGSDLNDPEKADRAAEEAWSNTEAAVNNAAAEAAITEEDVIDNLDESDFEYTENAPESPVYDETRGEDYLDIDVEEKYRDIFEADIAAKLEADDPASRLNVINWIREHGRIRFDYVEKEFGAKRAGELRKHVGPGLFSKTGAGLDEIAQELTGLGVPIAGDNALFNLLMQDAVPPSPLETAKQEGRDEVKEQYRAKYAQKVDALREKAKKRMQAVQEANKKKRADYTKKLNNWKAERTAAFKTWKAAMEAGYKERGKAVVQKSKDRGQIIVDNAKQAAEDIRKAEADRRSLNRSRERLKKSMLRDNNSALHKMRKNMRTAADNIVASRKVSSLFDVTPWVKSMKGSRQNADKALRAGDEALYKGCREREAFALEVIRAHYRAQAEAEYIRRKLKHYATRKAHQTMDMDADHQYQLDALLSRFETERLTKKDAADMSAEELTAAEKAVPLADFIADQAKDGVSILIPGWILNSNEKTPYHQLMMYQLRDVFESAKNIIKVGRDAKRTISNAKNAELADIEGDIFSAAKKFYGDKVVGRMFIRTEKDESSFIGTALDDLKTPEAICRAVDGYSDNGPMQRYVFRPIRDAQTRESLELARMFGEFRKLKDRVYGAGHKESDKKFSIGVVEYERVPDTDPERKGQYMHVPTKKQALFTREMLICAALNMGNEGNMQRLADGWGWTPGDMETIKSKLTDKDWEYVQGVWDLLQTMWPQIKKVHELMTGQTISQVESKEFKTSSGKVLRGGYYPIVTDLRYSVTAAGQSERKEIMASAPMQYANKSTESGHRKERAENVLGRPPLLELGVLDNHVANVIHDYELSSALRDVRMIMKRDLVRQTVKEALGERVLKDLTKWLNDVAANTKNNGVAMSTSDRMVSGLKSSTAMFALGGNLGGALMQPLGYFALAHRIGPVQVALAILNGLNPGNNTYEFVRSKSPFMREQMDNGQTNEIRMLRKNWTAGKNGISGAGEMMLSVYPLLQNLCNVPGWAQCYRIGMNRYGNGSDAVAYADSVIRQTQSASLLSDLSTVERSGAAGQLITMFYSWFRVMYQMQNEALMKVKYEHGIGRVKDLASYVFYVLIGQSIAEALLRGNGPDPDDDDPYKWVKWTAGRMFYAPLGTIPLVREFGSSMQSEFKFGVKLTPAQGALDGVARLLKVAQKTGGNVIDGNDVEWGDVGEAAATVAGYKYGIPNRAMIKAAQAFWQYYDEDKAIPWLYLTLGSGYKPKNGD